MKQKDDNDLIREGGVAMLEDPSDGLQQVTGDEDEGEEEAYEEPADEEQGVTPINKYRRAYSNGSYLTAVQILSTNHRNVLEGRKLEWNEMTSSVYVARSAFEDNDVSKIRANIENNFTGAVKSGQALGLKVSREDIYFAAEQIARETPYHPVREFLSALDWDGIERIDSAVEDILDAAKTPLNCALLRRWMTGAVARAFSPGCKMDTVLILIGGQGKKKSSFFRWLAGPEWFADTAFDIHSKDGTMLIHSAWIIEWAELETLRRAPDIAAAKGYVSSPLDSLRMPYGKITRRIPRSSVFCATCNPSQFLTDDENRRWWTMRVGQEIDIRALKLIRSQLWAEAVHLFRTWERDHEDEVYHPAQWWLSEDEGKALVEAQRAHKIDDPWAPIVESWVSTSLHVDGFTTSDVLKNAIKKDTDKWSGQDQHRVVSILKELGWRLPLDKPAGQSRKWERR